MSQLPPRLVDILANRYRFERELGGGGMSRVFVAEESALRRTVVVKVLTPTLAAGACSTPTSCPCSPPASRTLARGYGMATLNRGDFARIEGLQLVPIERFTE